MRDERRIAAPVHRSQSTLLVGQVFHERFLAHGSITGKGLSRYLHRLLNDPRLEYKLQFLKPEKWKKGYQEKGQSLVRLFFYPEECDWARLSLISNATGFSRCYIFVYLMLLDTGFLKLPNDRTLVKFPRALKLSIFLCTIFLDEKAKILTRIIQT